MTPKQCHLSSQLLTKFLGGLDGQAFKGLSTKSIGGRLRWRGEGLYKEKATVKNGACNLRRKKKRRTHCI